MEDNDWSFDQIRGNASQWSLAGDCALLNAMEKIHKDIDTKTRDTGQKIDALNANLSKASLDLQLVNNHFMGLSSTQFVENRVYDDDDDIEIKQGSDKLTSNIISTAAPPKSKEELNNEAREKSFKVLKDSLLTLENLHDRLRIMPDSDSDSEENSADEESASVILKPKNVYSQRPLPHIIGSQQWRKKWHIGLMESSSSSESENDERHKTTEQFSGSDGDEEIRRVANGRLLQSDANDMSVMDDDTSSGSDFEDTKSNIIDSSGSPSKSLNTYESDPNSGKAKPMDFATELARKLQANVGKPQAADPGNVPEVKKMKIANNDLFSDLLLPKPHERVTGNIFSDEPPPIGETDETDDIFPYTNDQTVDDLFSDFQPYESTTSKSNSLFQTQKSYGGLFDDLMPSDKVKPATKTNDNLTSKPTVNKIETAANTAKSKNVHNVGNNNLFSDDSAGGLFDDANSSIFGNNAQLYNDSAGNVKEAKNHFSGAETKLKTKPTSLFDDLSDSDDGGLFSSKKSAPSHIGASSIPKDDKVNAKSKSGLFDADDLIPSSIRSRVKDIDNKLSSHKTPPKKVSLFDDDSDADASEFTTEVKNSNINTAGGEKVSILHGIGEDRATANSEDGTGQVSLKKPIGGVSIFGNAPMKGPDSIGAAILKHRRKSSSDESDTESSNLPKSNSRPTGIEAIKVGNVSKEFDTKIKSNLFSDNSDAESFSENVDNSSLKSNKEKKPIGGVPIFGNILIQGPDSIGAAILKHRRISSSDTETSDASKTNDISTGNETVKVPVTSNKPKAKTNLFSDDSDSDLFSGIINDSSLKSSKEKNSIDSENSSSTGDAVDKRTNSKFSSNTLDFGNVSNKQDVIHRGLFDDDSDSDIFEKKERIDVKKSKQIATDLVNEFESNPNENASLNKSGSVLVDSVSDKENESQATQSTFKTRAGAVSIFGASLTKDHESIGADILKQRRKLSTSDESENDFSKELSINHSVDKIPSSNNINSNKLSDKGDSVVRQNINNDGKNVTNDRSKDVSSDVHKRNKLFGKTDYTNDSNTDNPFIEGNYSKPQVEKQTIMNDNIIVAKENNNVFDDSPNVDLKTSNKISKNSSFYDSDDSIFGGGQNQNKTGNKQGKDIKVIVGEPLSDPNLTPSLSLFNDEPPEFDSFDDKVLTHAYEDHDNINIFEDFNANNIPSGGIFDEPPPLGSPTTEKMCSQSLSNSTDDLFIAQNLDSAKRLGDIFSEANILPNTNEVIQQQNNEHKSLFYNSDEENLFKSSDTSKVKTSNDSFLTKTVDTQKESLNVTADGIIDKSIVSSQDEDKLTVSKKNDHTSNNIAKLKNNLNINVSALMPGARQKHSKSGAVKDIVSSDSLDSSVERDYHVEKKSISFDHKPGLTVLSNAASKDRARIQTKRRPSSRKARQEAIRNSAIFSDLESDTTDASETSTNNSSPHVLNDIENNENVDSSLRTNTSNQPKHIKTLGNAYHEDNDEQTDNKTHTKLIDNSNSVTSQGDQNSNRPNLTSEIKKGVFDESNDLITSNEQARVNEINNISNVSALNNNIKTDIKELILNHGDDIVKSNTLDENKSIINEPKDNLFTADNNNIVFTKLSSEQALKINMYKVAEKIFLDSDSDTDLFSSNSKSSKTNVDKKNETRLEKKGATNIGRLVKGTNSKGLFGEEIDDTEDDDDDNLSKILIREHAKNESKSLFGDDLDDMDLFGAKPSKAKNFKPFQPPQPKNEQKPKSGDQKTKTTTEAAFQDPLTLFTDDN